MFYKERNVLAVLLSCALVLTAWSAKAQGLVSLSEEAMFDDGLESSPEIPTVKAPAQTNQNANPEPATVVAPNAPKEAPKATSVKSLPQTAVDKDAPIDVFGDDGVSTVDGDLFTQMSDLEKRTALLNLELRREKLQNEIEAVKNQRRQALQQEQEKIEQQKLKNLEFEKEQEKKVLVEQQKLRDLDIQFEKLRQEKILGAYKNQMLEETQKWIENNAGFYKQIADLRQSKKDLTEKTKAKLETLQKEAASAQKVHTQQIESYKREVRDLQSQLGVLRNRIKAIEKENEEMKRNPFAGGGEQAAGTTAVATTSDGNDEITQDEPIENDLSKLYAVTEIRGQGNELIAKLVNKNGTAFYVKKGTALQTGHIIGEITTTYVTAERAGEKNYLYFAAGGIVPVETSGFEIEKKDTTPAEKKETKGGPVAGSL